MVYVCCVGYMALNGRGHDWLIIYIDLHTSVKIINTLYFDRGNKRVLLCHGGSVIPNFSTKNCYILLGLIKKSSLYAVMQKFQHFIR